MSTTRTFIVRVTESPGRVVVEDVREGRRAVAIDLNSVGAQIAAWLQAPGLHELDHPGSEDSLEPSP